MAEKWIFSMVSVLIVSAASLVGLLALSLNQKVLKRVVLLLVGFAVGALFGDAFIHLLPEAFEKMGSGIATSLNILLGIILFFLLEKFLRWRHCHVLNEEEEKLHPVVTMNLVGDFFHNLIDGMIIGVSYAVSIPIGITTTIAVLLHEIPQEMGDFAILVRGGLPVKKALWFNLLVSLTAVLGAVLALTLGSLVQNFAVALLPITAGGFIYIAGSDLIPELHHQVDIGTSLMQLVMILMGVGVMALLTLLEV